MSIAFIVKEVGLSIGYDFLLFSTGTFENHQMLHSLNKKHKIPKALK